MSRSRALGIYFATIVPFGLVVHLLAESAALARDPLALAASPMHWYMGALALAAIGALYAFVSSLPSGERRRQLALFVRALPFAGAGRRFGALTVASEMALFLATEFAEHGPLGPHDFALALVTALAAAVAGAFALRAVHRRFARIVAIVCGSWTPAAPQARPRVRHRFLSPLRPQFAVLASRGSRPPPRAPCA